jgi:YidC/Oxa1 family membrane protein insertase
MDQKNLVIAIALSVAIILGWQFLVAPSPEQQRREQQEKQRQIDEQRRAQPAPGSTPPQAGTAPQAPGAPAPAPTTSPTSHLDRPTALGRSPRVTFRTPELEGSIALKGGRIDDVRLVKHRISIDRNSGMVPVLSPEGVLDAYYAEFGWALKPGGTVKVPGPDTLWTADRQNIEPGQPVTLSWDNGEGQIFRQKIELDRNFMFTITQSVENKGTATVDLAPYGLVTRHGEPKTEGIYLLHEGPYGVFDGKLKEFDWSDFKEGKNRQQLPTTGGWLGFTDKYWMATLIPDQKDKVSARIFKVDDPVLKRYQADYTAPLLTIDPGTTKESTARLFAGAKIVHTINDYTENLGIARFDLSIDWGWFWFFTKPLFWLLDKIFGLIGNFGVAILALTVIVKLLFFPLANKSYESMTKMKKLQPEMEKLRERYGEDKMKMNQELMAMYKREKVNPAAGCVPVLLQIPVFFALYKVLYTTIEMRHQPFFGWIRDLAAPDPLTLLKGFGLLHWHVPEILSIFDIGIWPIIMGITMYLQQMMNPQPADPVQARIFQFLPIMFTFMLAPFAAGLVIYWAWNNTLSMAQQYVIMRKLGVPVTFGAKMPAPASGKPADKR